MRRDLQDFKMIQTKDLPIPLLLNQLKALAMKNQGKHLSKNLDSIEVTMHTIIVKNRLHL